MIYDIEYNIQKDVTLFIKNKASSDLLSVLQSAKIKQNNLLNALNYCHKIKSSLLQSSLLQSLF